MRLWTGTSLKDDQYNSVGAVWQAVSIELSGYIMRHMLLVSAKERLGSPWVEKSGDSWLARAGWKSGTGPLVLYHKASFSMPYPVHAVIVEGSFKKLYLPCGKF